MIEGLNQLDSALSRLESTVEDAMEDAAMAGALVGERYTKEGAPVKTGFLRRSYASRIEKKSSTEVMARTGTDTVYAPPQEFGTSRMPGTPHLRIGFLNHKSEIVNESTKVFKGRIR
jgi:HK97 gp10 family phage protein